MTPTDFRATAAHPHLDAKLPKHARVYRQVRHVGAQRGGER